MAEKNNKKADIVTVARAARVSPSTVSRCFNHPNLVNPVTRRRIEKAVEKLGYIRNRTAQVMHGKRSGTVGLIVPTVNHAIFAEVIQSFSESMEEEGFTILISTHGFDLDREYAVLRKLLEHRVDGVALIGLDHREATYQLIARQGVPAIAVWNHRDDSPIASIGVDNIEAGRVAAEHLLSLGHREIGVVFPPTQENDRARARLAGAQQAMAAHGVTVPQGWHLTSQYSIAEAKTVVSQALGAARHPTALLCGNDVIAQGVLYAAASAGLRVPVDLSIMGIGDFPGSGEVEPALSTVRLPARRIGSAAGKALVAKILSAGTGASLARRFDVELLMRGSTCAPR